MYPVVVNLNHSKQLGWWEGGLHKHSVLSDS